MSLSHEETDEHHRFAAGCPRALLGFAFNLQLAPAITGKQAELVAALDGALSGSKPDTFLGRGDTAARAFPADSLTRLREVKRSRDPENVFRANFPVLAEPE